MYSRRVGLICVALLSTAWFGTTLVYTHLDVSGAYAPSYSDIPIEEETPEVPGWQDKIEWVAFYGFPYVLLMVVLAWALAFRAWMRYQAVRWDVALAVVPTAYSVAWIAITQLVLKHVFLE